jgi:hypothetical protein
VEVVEVIVLAIVVRAVRVMTTAAALSLAGYTTVAMLTLPRI